MKQLEMKNSVVALIVSALVLVTVLGCGKSSRSTQNGDSGGEVATSRALLADGTSSFRGATWVCGDSRKSPSSNTHTACVSQTQLYQQAQSDCTPHYGVVQFSFLSECAVADQIDSASGIRGKTYSVTGFLRETIATTLKVQQINSAPCSRDNPCPAPMPGSKPVYMSMPAPSPVYVKSDKQGNFSIDVPPGKFEVTSADTRFDFSKRTIDVVAGHYSTVLIYGASAQRPGSCIVNGRTYDVGASFSKDCNTCTCLADGNVACTLRYCAPPSPQSCVYNGRSYPVGDSFSPDRCNVCTCSKDGSFACTKRVCNPTPPTQSRCGNQGISYPVGDSFVPSECNICTCSIDGSFACTKIACGEPGLESTPLYCSYGGQYYSIGDSFPSVDGCNRCNCIENGQVACTAVACAPIPRPNSLIEN